MKTRRSCVPMRCQADAISSISHWPAEGSRISVSAPRGKPPQGRASSSAAKPLGVAPWPRASGRPARNRRRSCRAFNNTASSPAICRSALALEPHRGVASLANAVGIGGATRLALQSDGGAQPSTSGRRRGSAGEAVIARRAHRIRRV